MPLSQSDQSAIDTFFAQIEPIERAYRFPTFRFVAILCKEEWVLFHGMLSLGTVARQHAGSFESEHIFAGEAPLSAIAPDAKRFVTELVSGRLSLNSRTCAFPADGSGHHHAHNVDFDGHVNKRDQAARLTLSGGNNYYMFVQQPWIRRELVTSHLALESLSELAAHYEMTFGLNMDPSVQIYAPAAGEISEGSRLGLGSLHLEFCVPGALDPSQFSITARACHQDGQTTLVPKFSPKWTGGDQVDWKGTADVEVGNAVDVRCYLSSKGFLHDQRVVSEPIKLRDGLHFAYDEFATDTASFEKVINDDGIRQRDGREFEYTVAAMLSLAGFRTLSIDHLPAFGEVAPDIVAVDSRGQFLLVECTLKLPNAAADKMTKLAHRKLGLETALKEARLGHRRVLAVMACAWPNSKLVPFLPDAGKADILLWGRDNLQQMRTNLRTLTAEALFDGVSDELAEQNLILTLGNGM